MATVIRSLGIADISGYPLGVEVSIIAGMPLTNTPGQVCSLTSFTSEWWLAEGICRDRR